MPASRRRATFSSRDSPSADDAAGEHRARDLGAPHVTFVTPTMSTPGSASTTRRAFSSILARSTVTVARASMRASSPRGRQLRAHERDDRVGVESASRQRAAAREDVVAVEHAAGVGRRQQAVAARALARVASSIASPPGSRVSAPPVPIERAGTR